jgi:hypothetical protein
MSDEEPKNQLTSFGWRAKAKNALLQIGGLEATLEG